VRTVPSIKKQLGLVSVFGLLILLILINAGITQRQLQVQIAKRQEVAHSQSVLLELSETISSLKDAETGQRGYLYTNDLSYLEPYQKAIGEVRQHIDKLSDLSRDNLQQQERVGRLHALADTKLQELAHTIQLNQQGRLEEARQMVLTNSGKRTMDLIRALAAEMWAAESALERERSADYLRSTNRTVTSIYLATLAAIVALVMVAVYLFRNIHDREVHAAIIREREQWFRVTLNSIGDGVMATDPQGRVVFLNGVAEQLTGLQFDDARNRGVDEVFPIFNEMSMQPVPNPVGQVLEKGVTIGLANHTVLKHKDGRLTPIEDSAAPIRNDQGNVIGVVLVFRDATHERNTREVMRRAEKLATAGRLAATMAHEINNPLEAVGNLIFLTKTAVGLPESAYSYLEQAETQLDRVSHITRQTLGFYRESAEPTEISIPAIIDSVLRIYSNKLQNKGITVEREFEERTPAIKGLAGELRQIMANLISNAADALQDNGRLIVSVAPAQRNGTRGVEVRVRDNGTGIAPENMERIFEPFFTTKADVGTGLGLFVTRQLTEHHGGTVTVESKQSGENRGTEFTIFLPTGNAHSAAEAAS